MAKLTKTLVGGTPTPDGTQRIFLWDTEVKGFGLQITPKGVRTYVLQYRLLGRSRRIAVGRHGNPWTVDKARSEARRLLEFVVSGVDPMERKVADRETVTVRELAQIYLEDGPNLKPSKKSSSWKTDRSNIRRHILPLLGHRPVRSLTADEIGTRSVKVMV